MSIDRSKYRNPSPPPGYVCENKPELRLKDGLIKIDGIICQFILPMIELGVFDLEGDFSKFVINSDSEDEVVEVPVPPKQPPVIDLESDEEESATASALPTQPKQTSVTDLETEEGELPSEPIQDVPTVEQIASVSKKHISSIERKEKETVKKSDASSVKQIKKSQSDKIPVQAPPVQEPEQVIQKSKLPSVKKKHSSRIVSRRESSSSSDGGEHSRFSKSPVRKVEYIGRNRSTSRGRSPERHSKHEGSPKRRTLKKERREGYSSDNSAHSSYSRRSPREERRRSLSRSRSPENVKANVKQDPGDHNLFGRYHCPMCNATMNSRATYETHLNGKRHLKNSKLQNVAETVQKTVPQPIQVESKYPPPPPGVRRVKSRKPAKIQAIVENPIGKPCPGLDNVIEIQGINETTYYCQLCSAPCTTATIISHLTGYRHLLRCLKHFDRERYEMIHDRQKYEVEMNLMRWLVDIERRFGRGRIVVEEEIPCENTDSYGSSYVKHERMRREDMPGPSHRDPDDSFPEDYANTTIPDTSKSDFYCRICDSHMNNVRMWDMHVRGKRHLANVKKGPGELPSKAKTVLLEHARARIMDEIDDVEEPIVGLSKMREVQNPEAPGELYNCFLCGACLTRRDVVEHLLSTKHRKKYLEDINHPEMATLKEMYMLDSTMYSIIEEICAKVEAERGRGTMEVHTTKNAFASGRKW